MDVEPDDDTNTLAALHNELKELNAAAFTSGLLAPRDVPDASKSARSRSVKTGKAPAAAIAKRASKVADQKMSAAGDGGEEAEVAPGDWGKAGATRLLAMLARAPEDESPPVPGTTFTEAGVVRLLAHLRKRRSQGYRFLQRLQQFLIRPVAMGIRTSAGISVERLQVVSRQLLEIEAHGWDRFKTIRAARRGKSAPAESPAQPSAKAPRASKGASKAAGSKASGSAKPGSKAAASKKLSSQKAAAKATALESR